MNEKDLKSKINDFRHEIDAREKEISALYSKLNLHKAETDKIRVARDQLNGKVKELSSRAKECRDLRDKLNREIVEHKKKYKALITDVKGLNEKIKKDKQERDKLNKTANGSEELLDRIYAKNMGILTSKDIPLEDEIRLFEQMSELTERRAAAKKATVLHNDVLSSYKQLKEYDSRIAELSAKIDSMKAESDTLHKKALEAYAEISVFRDKSNEQHKILLEKYTVTDPIRSRIDSLKEEIKRIQGEMAPFLEDFEKLSQAKVVEKRVQTAKEAMDKLKHRKRVSLDDFKVLMENGGLQVSDN